MTGAMDAGGTVGAVGTIMAGGTVGAVGTVMAGGMVGAVGAGGTVAAVGGTEAIEGGDVAGGFLSGAADTTAAGFDGSSHAGVAGAGFGWASCAGAARVGFGTGGGDASNESGQVSTGWAAGIVEGLGSGSPIVDDGGQAGMFCSVGGSGGQMSVSSGTAPWAGATSS
ncbi:MAG TPA: hypothetical protein VGS16_08990 [Candidatus Dormibacteraeota bacterium]|nr:hypothetical protein [Candidatus Dormibacteraeota bacterium]